MSDNKLVTGGLLFTAVSLFTYHFMGDNLKPRRIRRNYNYKTTIAPIIEEELEIFEELHKTKTPSNTPTSKQILNLKTDISDLNLNHPVYNEKESPLVDNTNEISEIIETIDNFDKNKLDSATNSMSSFLELCNTGSQTDTEELEFLKVDIILKNIISNITDRNIYGNTEPEVVRPTISPTISFNDKIYSESNSYILNISYYSDGEIYKRKKRKKVNRVLKFLKRNKSN